MQETNRMKRFAFLIIVALLLAPGCATTKNVLNKATFGVVDAAEEDPAAKAAKAEAKEEKKADKEARKEAERARKQAEREKKQEPEVYVSEDTNRSWASTLTFGLIGPKDPDKEAAKQARKEEKRARKAEKEAEERERKEARKQAKLEEETPDKEEQPSAGKRGWANKLTFGLIGGEEDAEEREAEKAAERERKAAAKAEKREREQAEKAEKQVRKEAERRREEAEKAERRARKEAEEREEREQEEAERAAKEEERAQKQARREAEAEEANEQDDEKRGWASRLTFGLVGGKEDTEAEAPEEMAAKSEPEPTEPQEAEDEILVEEAKPADEIEPVEEPEPEEEPEPAEEVVAEEEEEFAAEDKDAEPKRTLVSRLTFGLVGGEKGDAESADGPAEDPEEVSPKEARKAEKKREKQLAKAAEESRKEAIATLPDGARKLAKMPFNTSVQDEEQWSGETVRVADRESYSENGYGITDIGDVRIAVEGMTFDGTWRTGRLVIDSSEEGALSGSSGIGNRRFTYKYSDGVMQCSFGSISFRIADSLLSIDGVDVPLGQGRHLLIVSPAGEVLGNYPIE